MAKVTDAPVEQPVQDARSDSGIDLLAEIANEEIAEQAEAQAKTVAAEAAEAENTLADIAHEWRGALEAGRVLLVEMIPELDPVWSPPRLDKLSVALARCDQEYGWGGVGELAKSPLVALAVAGGPIAWGTYTVIKPKMEAAKAAKLEAARQNAIKPGSMTQEQLAVAKGAPAFGS
jgi:hypothetical protein